VSYDHTNPSKFTEAAAAMVNINRGIHAMVSITFLEPTGAKKTVEAKGGFTVMEAAVAAGVVGIDAICGGGCSCGTCHVHLQASQIASFTPPDYLENEMLDLVQNRTDASRLSCQLTLSDVHRGMMFIVPSPNGPE
jgi:2Fe-2S ferredoxin